MTEQKSQQKVCIKYSNCWFLPRTNSTRSGIRVANCGACRCIEAGGMHYVRSHKSFWRQRRVMSDGQPFTTPVNGRSSNQVTNANLSAQRHQHSLLHVSNEQSSINIIIIIIIIIIMSFVVAETPPPPAAAAAAASGLVAMVVADAVWWFSDLAQYPSSTVRRRHAVHRSAVYTLYGATAFISTAAT